MYQFLFILLVIGAVGATEKFKICATESISETTCNALERSRGDVQFTCLRVTDSAECAIRLVEGKADFGIFNAEEMLLAYQFYPDTIQPIFQLRHKDRIKEDYVFQSVAVVPSSFDARNGLAGLKNGGFCHPGFSESQIWNDRILKDFEKRVYAPGCRDDFTASENEAEDLKNFFADACRPGEWVADASVDKELKSKYPELCELCDDKSSCTYRNSAHNGHFGALECLASGQGKVAYVAYEYVCQFFGLNSNVSLSPLALPVGFKFLCADGTTRPLTSEDPCAWIRQPWSTVLARKERATKIFEELKKWLLTATVSIDDIILKSSEDWVRALKSIIIADDLTPIDLSTNTSLQTYLTNGRDVDLSKYKTCGKVIRWCTINEAETNKCNWIAKEAIALGIEPNFVCLMANSTFDCLRRIAEDKADIMTIDSNYGHIARQVFNLTTTMYTETHSDRNSQVIGIVREGATKISTLQDLKKQAACFPEYDGIAWLSFLNTARKAKIVSNSCDYSQVISEFFSAACAPGIRDADHSIDYQSTRSSDSTEILCSLCPIEHSESTCSANQDNHYYGDEGALECIKSGNGDVAFVEAKNLIGKRSTTNIINPKDFRVLCKNGSLAIHQGFEIDEPCAFSVTIDSEVISRKNNSQIFTKDVTLALLKLENWLGYRVNVHRPIRIYDSFTGNADLLFKDSTVGLVSTSSEIKSVLAYKQLFSNVEACSGVDNIIANSITIFHIMSSIAFVRYIL